VIGFGISAAALFLAVALLALFRGSWVLSCLFFLLHVARCATPSMYMFTSHYIATRLRTVNLDCAVGAHLLAICAAYITDRNQPRPLNDL